MGHHLVTDAGSATLEIVDYPYEDRISPRHVSAFLRDWSGEGWSFDLFRAVLPASF